MCTEVFGTHSMVFNMITIWLDCGVYQMNFHVGKLQSLTFPLLQFTVLGHVRKQFYIFHAMYREGIWFNSTLWLDFDPNY